MMNYNSPKWIIREELFVLVKEFPALSVQKLSAILIKMRPRKLFKERVKSSLYLILGLMMCREEAWRYAGPFKMTWRSEKLTEFTLLDPLITIQVHKHKCMFSAGELKSSLDLEMHLHRNLMSSHTWIHPTRCKLHWMLHQWLYFQHLCNSAR